VGFVLIMVQMVMGVIGRSAPAMNLFAVGLPATLLAGVILLGILQAADDRLAPAFNPFEYGLKDLDREADFEAYPDPTRPEPVLVPATNPQ
ncbi:flagellar biosynthetic protein FliR, partial [bacterium]